MRDPSHKYSKDKRTSIELLELHRQGLKSNKDVWEPMAVLHYRGGIEEFKIGKKLTESKNPEDRCIGADVLAQLGWEDKTFDDESVEILIELLNDSDNDVIYCAAVGLGHRGSPASISYLLKLIDHKDAQVRYGITFGLCGQEDEAAIEALIKLSKDSDFDVRNWAVFGLGSQNDIDTPSIREALLERLNDENHEIRGEALVGLARRKDKRVFDALLKEWELDSVSMLSLEAAEELANPNLIPHLLEIESSLDLSDDERFCEQLRGAIAACEGTT